VLSIDIPGITNVCTKKNGTIVSAVATIQGNDLPLAAPEAANEGPANRNKNPISREHITLTTICSAPPVEDPGRNKIIGTSKSCANEYVANP
jgi:hypothetical protein